MTASRTHNAVILFLLLPVAAAGVVPAAPASPDHPVGNILFGPSCHVAGRRSSRGPGFQGPGSGRLRVHHSIHVQAVLALRALAVLRTHGTRGGISQTAQELEELTGVTLRQSRSLAMEAYLFPLQSLSLMVGLLSLRRIIGDRGTAQEHSAVTRRGSTVLWGVCA